MFKALLAALVAMLACCAAAVFAGPTLPLPADDASPKVAALDQPLHMVAPVEDSPRYDVPISFVPIPLSTSYYDGGAASAVGDEGLPLAPPVQAAVIPLPSPLYAALALLSIALIARRTMLRSC